VKHLHQLTSVKIMIVQYRATYSPWDGSGPPSKIIRLATPLPNFSSCMDRLVVLYFMNLHSLQNLLLDTYEELQHLWETALCYISHFRL